MSDGAAGSSGAGNGAASTENCAATATSSPLVNATNLLVGYGQTPVCAPATFSIRPGEALFVVGPNGAGKSTLLRTCCGLLPPLSGSISVLGRWPKPSNADFREHVCRDFGEEAFFPALSVREHLEMVCLGFGLPHAASMVTRALAEAGLEEAQHRVPDQLSSGQRRRLALAATWLRPHRLLVLDEPEQRLDQLTRQTLGKRLAGRRDAGTALLVCSHDPQVVAAAATSVLIVGPQTLQVSVAEGIAAMDPGQP